MSRAWMPLYIGDYLRDTQHLTVAQHGAYLLLIMHYWQHGGLPDNDAGLARISRQSIGAWRSNCPALAKLFLPGWRHKRIDKELARAKELSEKRAVFGAMGGRTNRGQSNAQRHLRKQNGEAIAKQKEQQKDDPQSHKKEEVAEKAVDNVDKSRISVTDELRANIKRWL